jgi:hypothetical protein
MRRGWLGSQLAEKGRANLGLAESYQVTRQAVTKHLQFRGGRNDGKLDASVWTLN